MKLNSRLKKTDIQKMDESFAAPDMTPAQRTQILEAFREHSQAIELTKTDKEKMMISLSQLKYLMEDYIVKGNPNDIYNFGFFLQQYIDRLGKKNKDFAEEIDIEPSRLSQIINRHRRPGEEFFIRLEIHANKNFPAIMWYKIWEKEKEYGLIHNMEIRDQEKKHVKNKLAFSF